MADKLLSTIGEWHELATLELGLLSLGKVDVEFGRHKVEPHAHFDPDTKKIGLEIPLEISAEGINREVPVFMVHENAHRRRDEAIETPEYYDDFRMYLFNGIIDEGAAGLAESAILDQEPNSVFTDAEQTNRRLLDGLLLDYLYFVGSSRLQSGEAKYNRYLFGTPTRLAERGYKIGHYIVSQTSVLCNLSVQEALEMPDEFYREFAEEHL